ncbi:MAG: ATP-dependent RecD-like DNA helicase [Ruminococcaceae bacterium]|nr:ATP-dependent RecD-like DNA helicase [Oscillospiraceae bacterium]
MNEENTISGIVDAIVYQNEENGYTVCTIETSSSDVITAVGTLPYITEGDKITASGEWINHNVYGRQFKVTSFDKSLPVEESDILRYLASGAVRGIGPKTAQKIVEKFGRDALEIIENNPDWLTDIPGITQKKALAISENYKEISGARSVMMFCRDFFTPETSMKIYKKWGGGAVDRIRNNPYSLCGEFRGISFRRADRIAAELGLAEDSEDRIRHGIAYVLSNESAKMGHTCLPESLLIRCTAELLFGGDSRMEGEITDCLNCAIAQNKLVAVTKDGERLIYLPPYFKAETYSAKKLKQLSRNCARMDVSDIELIIQKSEAESGISYASLQRQAIAEALSNGVMLLTGGPGTGKTTIIKGLISIFNSLDYEVCLAAPTGRAAKRMSEATSHEAKTIHRLLEMDASSGDGEFRFLRNDGEPLEEDVIIIDEASMLDVLLLEALLKAIRNGARLILIGDEDQLPSVGAGNVLADIASSEAFRVVRLTEVFRQSETSLIITNAHRINEGVMPDIRKTDADFFYLNRETEEGIRDTVIDLVKNRLPKSYGAHIGERIQIITPSRKGMSGTEVLNAGLQSALNPPSPQKNERRRGDIIFREGDRVMQTKNNYGVVWETPSGNAGMGIYNGDIGTILSIDSEEEVMEIRFDDRLCVYDFGMLDELDHAYAVTVHKSQGSEYPVVIIPLFRCAPMLMTRNLLYTAVTRASKMVILVGSYGVLEQMVKNNSHSERCTLLGEFLKKDYL